MTSSRRARRGLAAAFLSLVLLPAALAARPAVAAGGPYAGRPLAEVLVDLQAQGLTLVFTSELVRPGMIVAAEPAAIGARAILEEVLAPHGLAIEEGPGGVLVVVAGAAPAAGAGAIEGSVVDRGSREGLPGAVVRVVGSEVGGARLAATAAADGAFSLAPLPAGDYSLEASAPGYLAHRVDGVTVAAGAPRRVVFRLHPELYIKDEIVVRPSRLALLAERPESSFALGREEIQSVPHLGGDLFRAASLLPGVTANDVTARFSVRGGRRDEVKVVLDGQELFGAYHLLDYDGALSLVPAAVLGGVDLTTGAYPANQGDRMSAVLDLRTLDPSSGRHWALGAGVLDLSAAGSGRFAGERGGWLVTARRGSLDLAADAIGDEDPSYWDLLAKAELDAAGGLLRAHALVAADELEIDRTEEEDFERLENDYGHGYGWLTHQASPGGRMLIDSLASWARLDSDRAGAGTDEEGGHLLRDRRDLEVATLSQTFSLDLGGHLPRWGWEARRYEAVFDYAKALDQDVVILAPFSAPRLTEHAFEGSLRGEHLALWASDRLSLGDRLSAELGLRWDRHDLTGDTLLSPRINLARRVGDHSVARAAWGRFHQSQRPYELQVEDGLETLAPAERSDQWVLGWESLLEAGPAGLDALRLELYGREIDNPRLRFESLLEPLNFFPEIEPDRVRIAPERSRSEGIELLLLGSRGERFDWRLAYALARAEDRLEGEWVPRSLDQEHTVSLGLHFRLPRRWNLDLAWRFHGGWPTTPVAAAFVIDPDDPEAEPELVGVFGPLNSERLPDYHRLDLRASRRWTVRSGLLTLYADVQNLYDRENLAGFDFDLDEETGEAILEPEDWPGIFPSVGVLYEF